MAGVRWAAAALALALVGAAPVEETTDDGTIDWTHGTVRALGVGTPRILSPTGALTDGDPYEIAKGDAQARLRRLLARVRLDAAARLGQVETLTPALDAAVRAYRADAARTFSDGTVHLPARVDLAWIPAAVAGAPPPRLPAEAGAPTGLVVQVEGGASPALRVRLTGPDGASVFAGLPTDPIGAEGVAWVRDATDAPEGLVGDRPARITARAAGRGVLAVAGGDVAPLFLGRIRGGLVVVIR